MGKALILIGAGLYLLSPLDFVPDVIPIVGWADDLGIITWAFNSVFAKAKAKAIEATNEPVEE